MARAGRCQESDTHRSEVVGTSETLLTGKQKIMGLLTDAPLAVFDSIRDLI